MAIADAWQGQETRFGFETTCEAFELGRRFKTRLVKFVVQRARRQCGGKPSETRNGLNSCPNVASAKCGLFGGMGKTQRARTRITTAYAQLVFMLIRESMRRLLELKD